MKIHNLMLSLLLVASFGLAGCNTDYGKTVEQGRCVAFTGDKVTFVRDTNVDPRGSAKYEGTVLTFNMPADPKEKGPEPAFGSFVSFNIDKSQIQVFKDGALSTVAVQFENVKKGVERHADEVKGKMFPMLNAEKKEVTVYANMTLATFKIPADLPDTAQFWTRGDDVRVFFKEKGQALRFMNISKTNIFKK